MEASVRELAVGVAVKGAPREWPLFSAPAISSLRVTNVKEKGGTLYFTVQSILEGFKWKIDKTYDDFVELQKVLINVYGMEHPVLPGYRKLFGLSLFMGVKENQAAEMRDKLEAFLIKVVTHFPIPPTELLNFVEYPFTDVLSVTQALAKFFYVEGDMVLSNNKAVQMSPLQLHCVNKRMTLPLGSSETGKMKDDFGHLLDFLQNLRKLKVSPPTEEHAVIEDLDHLTFELSQMKSLEVLLVESVHIQQLETKYTLPDQLVKLEVRRSLKLLQDVLLVYPPSDVEHSPASPALPSLLLSAQEVDLSRALKWTKLQQANFKLNGIKLIDQSVKLLAAVEILDLSFNYIEEIQHLVDLPHLRVLNLGHNKISDLRDLHTKLGCITKLSLASNNIVKLIGIEKMFSIQFLDLSNNHISDASEVGYLKTLPCLSDLLLKGNPIAHSLSYRSQIFGQISTYANQVSLDGKQPSKDELVVSMGTSSAGHGHKRVPSRTPDIEPDESDAGRQEPALEDMEAGLGLTNRLEELRKEGGDRWLSILNSTSTKEEEEELVVGKSPKGGKKKKGKHHQHHKDKGKKAPLEQSSEHQVPVILHSERFARAMSEVQKEKFPNLVNFSVTVLEHRNSAFLSLSDADLDQILVNTAMGECTLSVDTLIGKAKEFDLHTNSVKIMRELGTVHYLKVHEKKKLAVCLRLPSNRNRRQPGSRWVIYCVQDLTSLARLYLVIKTAMARSRSVSPDRPLNEIIQNIASEMESSLPSPLSPPSSLLRSQSDSDSLPSYTRYRFDSASNSFTDSLPTTLTSPEGPSINITDPCEVNQDSIDNKVFLPEPLQVPSLTSSTEISSSMELSVSQQPATGYKVNEIPTQDFLDPLTDKHTPDLSNDRKKVSPPLRSSKEGTPSASLSPQDDFTKLSSSQDALCSSQEDTVLSPSRTVDSSSGDDRGNSIDGGTTGKKHASESESNSRHSGNSSRAGSGSNTPKAQKHIGKKERSNSSSKHSSPQPVATPPMAATRKPPPKGLTEELMKNIKDIADSELASPLYRKDSGTNIGTVNANGGGVDEQDGSDRTDNSIFDRQSSTEKESVVKKAVEDSSSLHIRERRPRKHNSKSSTKVIVTKPGLDSSNIVTFFRRIVAEDSAEVLMNVTWGIANFSSAPLCEVEVGVMISDRAVYVLEVLDPDRHLSRPLSWDTENLPLGKVMKFFHADMRRVDIGIFDQSVNMEGWGKGASKKFVLFPLTQEKLNLFVENLKAAFDATGLQYSYSSSKDAFRMANGKEEMMLRNPGALDMAALKDSMVWSRSLAQVGNFIASNSKSDTSPLSISFEAEMKRMSSALSSKFEIVQYVIIGEVTSDTLPISQGGLHVCSRALILTNKMIYLCKEELDSWAHGTTAIRRPPFPRCIVLDAHPVSRVAGIRVCDKSHPVVSCSDPLYEFAILFKEMDELNVSPLWTREWKLCAHDRQYLDQLLECLLHLSNEYHKDKPLTIKHVASKMSNPPSPKLPNVLSNEESGHRKMLAMGEMGSNKKGSANSCRGSNPCFFSSVELFEFSVCTNYQRLKFFKKHVAQAEFLKSDEIPVSMFLAHCSSSLGDYVEVEVCVVVSNYAIYLISDVDNIEKWLNSGGEFSYQRRDLLNRGDSNHIRCFYRLWLDDIKQVGIGLYYTSLAITNTKNPDKPRFVVHTENPSATLSFLNAMACIVELHDEEEEKQMDDLLAQYDLMDDTTSEETDDSKKKKKKPNKGTEKHKVEFAYKAEDSLDSLKKAMVRESPGITKGMSIDTCNKAIKILYQQVVLVVEELRIRDHLSSSYYPHYVFLTNFGLYLCLNNPVGKKCSPAVMHPSELTVKKWCHIDLLERLQVYPPSTKQYTCYNVVIHLRSSTTHRGSFSSKEAKLLSFLIQNSELLNTFLYHFSLMYHERCGKQISISWNE